MAKANEALMACVSTLLWESRDFDDSKQKSVAWIIFLSLTTKHRDLQAYTQGLRLLPGTTLLVHVTSGIGLCTMVGMHVHINVTIPRRTSKLSNTTEELINCLHHLHLGKALSVFAPEQANPIFRISTRMVSCPSCLLSIAISGNVVSCNNTTTAVVSDITSPHDITAAMKPIARMSKHDGDDMLYWHKFPCGRVVSFLNPPVSDPPEYVKLDILDDASIEGHCHDRLLPIAASLRTACRTYDVLSRTILRTQWVPELMKGLALHVFVCEHGLQDHIIATVHKVFSSSYASQDGLIDAIRRISTLMNTTQTVVQSRQLGKALRQCAHQSLWRSWAMRSAFVMSCVEKFSPSTLRSNCNLYAPLLSASVVWACMTIGEWTPDHRLKVDHLLCNRLRIDHLCQELDVLAHEMERSTHHALARRIAKRLGLDVTLIGSGVFSSLGDVDIIVRVHDASCLKEAYKHVMAKTGWAPCYQHVSGKHIAVLKGVEEGVHLDAQVWTGTECTEAEQRTASALRITSAFERRMIVLGRLGRERALFLHSWANAASCKGNCLCRLPGVAITYISVNLAHAKDLLSDIGDRLQTVHPRFCFDDDDDDSTGMRGAGVPQSAVRIMIDERNVARRATVNTTRQLLDTFVFAQTLCNEKVCCMAEYETWRRRGMVIGARVYPRSSSSVSLSLHTSLARLDGHPFVHSIHVAEGADDLTIWCRLNPDAHATRYGFLAEHRIIEGDRCSYVYVQRGGQGRATYLAISPARQCESCSAPQKVTDVLTVEGGCVPNAPTLTEDILVCFPRNLWNWPDAMVF